MKSSCNSLIPFLIFLQTQFLTGTHANGLLYPVIKRHGPHKKHNLSITEKACLLIRCLAIDVLLLRALASGGMCLLNSWGLYVTIIINNTSNFVFCKDPFVLRKYARENNRYRGEDGFQSVKCKVLSRVGWYAW
jgi:hypothetical protein